MTQYTRFETATDWVMRFCRFISSYRYLFSAILVFSFKSTDKQSIQVSVGNKYQSHKAKVKYFISVLKRITRPSTTPSTNITG